MGMRPSSKDVEKLKVDGMRLVEKYRRSNVIAYRDMEKVTRLSDPARVPLTDERWMKSIKSGRWEARGWKYDPGTTAHIYPWRSYSRGDPYILHRKDPICEGRRVNLVNLGTDP